MMVTLSGRITLMAVLAWPELCRADTPVIDRAGFGQHNRIDTSTNDIAVTDDHRLSTNTSVTCSVFRPARRNDPVSAAQANPSISGLVRRVAREQGVDENEFLALVYQESRFDPCARSSAGAIGLAQLMPGTAAQLGVNPHDIEDNLRGGATYYKQQLHRYDGNVPLALAAYNAGPGNVDRYGGIPPFKETQGYVQSITRDWLPALDGSNVADIPLNFGGGHSTYSGLRDNTLRSLSTSAAYSDSLPVVADWYGQIGSSKPGTMTESWDQNSAVRNGNLATMNAVIGISSVFAALINDRNIVSTSALSGSARSAEVKDQTKLPGDQLHLCDAAENLSWDETLKACVILRDRSQQTPLLLHPQ